MRWISIFTLGFCAARGLLAAPPVPRPAPEIAIETPEGKLLAPTAFRGKVVLMQFLYTTCIHCQATARMLSGLERELGPRGFQAVGIAFNEEAQNTPEAIHGFVAANQVNFPVGAASREAVMKYLGLSVVERFVVPQIVIVDRKGVIRAQSDSMGTTELRDEAYLRRFISGLLERATIPRKP
jgi:peroxiredoxin